MPWLAALLIAAAGPQDDPWAGLLDPRTPEELVEGLGSFHPLEVELARRRLAWRGAEARAALLQALDSPDARTLIAALELLGPWIERKDLTAVAGLAAHEHPSVRSRVARLLTRHDDPELRDTRDSLLQDPDPGVIAAALEEINTLLLPARVQLADQNLAVLMSAGRSAEPRLRRSAIRLLVLSDRPEAAMQVGELIEQWNATEQDLLVERMRRRPPRWPPSLVRPILDTVRELPGMRLRVRLLEFLLLERRSVGDEEFGEVVVAALGGPEPSQSTVDPEEQAAALELLARLGPPAGPRLRELLPELQGHPSFAVAADLVMKLRGPDSLGDLCGLLPHLEVAAAAEVLSLLPRLTSVRTAEVLERDVEPGLPLELRPALVECAMQLPRCEARSRMMLGALMDLRGEERLRPFEGLVREANPAHVGFLIDALDETTSPDARRRMTQMLAEAYGPLEPREILDVLSRLMESAEVTDRRAALSAVPFVALDEEQAIAEFLIARFEESEPDRLLLVLSQIGGPSAEATFARLATELAGQPERSGVYRFLLRQAGRLTGEPSGTALLTALEASDARTRTIAYRSLIQRDDPAMFRDARVVLESLDAAQRVALLHDLASARSRPGMRELLVELLPLFRDDESRIALFELAAPGHGELIRDDLATILTTATSEALQLAALEAHGRLGDPASRQVLEEAVRPVLGANHATLLELPERTWGRARAAALALAMKPDPASARALASVLLRGAARDSFWSLAVAVGGAEGREVATDPGLVQPLAGMSADVQLVALQTAQDELGPLAACMDERFYVQSADHLLRSGGPAEVARWLEQQALRTQPSRSATDTGALAHLSGARHGWLRVPLPVRPEQLGEIADLVAAFRSCTLSPRQRTALFGREDPFFGWQSERLLRVLSCLAGPGPEARRLHDAGREAGNHGIVLTTLARQATAVDPELALELARRAVAAAPYLPYALTTLVWLLDDQQHTAERGRVEGRLREVIESGLAAAHTVTFLHDAVASLGHGQEERARELIREASRRDPLAPWVIERDAAFRPLIPLLSGLLQPDGRD